MMYGTAHDNLNDHGTGLSAPAVLPSRTSRKSYRPGTLSGLAAPAYSSAPFIVDPVLGTVVSGVYGTPSVILSTSKYPQPFLAPGKLVYQNIVGNTAYLTFVDGSGAEHDATIALDTSPGSAIRQPQVLSVVTNGAASYTPSATPYASVAVPIAIVAKTAVFTGDSFDNLYGKPLNQSNVSVTVNGIALTPTAIQWFVSLVPSSHPGMKLYVGQDAYWFSWLNGMWVFNPTESDAAVNYYQSTIYPVENVFATAIQKTVPLLDPNYLYVLPQGASQGFYGVYGITSDNESSATIVNPLFSTGLPGIVVSGGLNSGIGFNIAASEQYDTFEIYARQIEADPNTPYIVWQADWKNLNKGTTGSYQWTESSGGGTGPTVADISRVITDVSTMGFSEVVGATAKAAGVSQSDIDLANEAYAAAAIAVATVGTITAVSAAPVAATAVTDASGATSLLAGSDATTLVSTVGATSAGGAVAVPTVATATAAGGSILGGAGAALQTGLVSAASTTAATALATEIKKLTGQLPGSNVLPPSQVTAAVAGTPAAAPVSTLTKWALGGIAALAILKKKS